MKKISWDPNIIEKCVYKCHICNFKNIAPKIRNIEKCDQCGLDTCQFCLSSLKWCNDCITAACFEFLQITSAHSACSKCGHLLYSYSCLECGANSCFKCMANEVMCKQCSIEN